MATQQAVTVGRGNVVIQIKGDGNSVAPGLPHLELTRYHVRRQIIRSEYDLLSPYKLSIPMVAREAAMADLWAWLNSGDAISVRVVTGTAGRGKTRLALELCEEATEKKWRAGFVSRTEMARFQDKQNLASWGWNAPSLIVVDYAAGLAEGLHRWLAELADNDALLDDGAGAGPPLRVLLLERQANPAAGWWPSVFGIGGGDTDAIQNLLDPDKPVDLPPIEDSEKRRAVLSHILEKAESDVRPPERGENPEFDRKLHELTWGGEPLFLMMAGLVASEAGFGEVLALSRADLAFRIADREMARIEKIAKEHAVPADFLCHMSAMVTLCQGLRHDDAIKAIRAEKLALDRAGAGDPPVIYAALREALSGPDDGLDPILPDMVGEAFVLRALAPLGEANGTKAVGRGAALARADALGSVIRTCQDYTIHDYLTPLAWLDGLVEAGGVDVSALMEIANALPRHTLVLRERAAKLHKTIGELLRMSLAAVGTDEQPPIRANLATSLNNLSNSLSDLGRREDALAANEEAVAIHRELAAARPDTFRPAFATSLNNLSVKLSNLGRRGDALAANEEAVAIHRKLAAARPDAFRPDLATSLNNLSATLTNLGRREDALAAIEEAVAIRRELAAARPDAFRPDLAASLNNLSVSLTNLGRREDALTADEEALDIYRELAAARPDAFRPDLAHSLHNLSVSLSDLGRREDALAADEEAIAIRRELAVARPDAFRPALAHSLHNLSVSLSDLGRNEDAHAVAEDAVSTLAPHFLALPEAHVQLMGTIIGNYVKRCSEAGREPDAELVGPVVRVLQELEERDGDGS